MKDRSRLSFALKFDRSEAIFGFLSLYFLTNLKIKQFNLSNKTITIVKWWNACHFIVALFYCGYGSLFNTETTIQYIG